MTRNPDYWGRELAVNRGFWNFDEMRFDYYRDANSYHEAFKKGLFDIRTEDDPGRWQTGYDFPALREGRVVKETFTSGLPKPISDFVFNTRRRGLRGHPRARGARAAVRLRVGQPQHLLRPLPPRRRATSRAPSCPRAAAPADDARARAAGALSRRGARRRARRHLGAAGERWLGTRPHAAAPRARIARGRRLRAARHGADRADERQAVRLRDPRRSTATRSGWRCFTRHTSSAPASPRRCASSTRCSTRRGASPSIST